MFFSHSTFLPFTAPQARQLPPLPGAWKPHSPDDPWKRHSPLPVAQSGREAPLPARHETKYDGAAAPARLVLERPPYRRGLFLFTPSGDVRLLPPPAG